MGLRVIAGILFGGAALCGTALAGDGFNVAVKYGSPTTIGDIDTGEAYLASGAPDATVIAPVVNYVGNGGGGSIGGDTTFPGYVGGNQDNFALSAIGYAQNSGTFNFGVNSDDGFRVRVNGTTIGEVTGPRGPGDTIFTATVNAGDQIKLTFFEDGGGDEVEFFTTANADGSGTRTLVNDLAGGNGLGIQSTPTPEPASMTLLGLGSLGLLARRRRA